MAEIFRIAFITLICQKSMKALGKKDYSDIIKFVGISICLLQIYTFFRRGFVNNTAINNNTWFTDVIKNITGTAVREVKSIMGK